MQKAVSVLTKPKPMANSSISARDLGDSTAILTGLAVFFQWLPAVAGILSIIYTLWRLIEALDHRKRQKLFPFAPFGAQPPKE